MNTKLPPTFWTDPQFDECSAETLCAILWIKTNDRLNLLGCAEVGPRFFEFQTRSPFAVFARACQALGKGLVMDGNTYWLRDFVGEQIGRGDALLRNNMRKPLVRALESVRSPLISEAIRVEYPELFEGDFEKPLVSPPQGPEKRREEKRGEEQSSVEQGGVGETKPSGRPQDLREVQDYAQSIGLPEEQAIMFFDHFEANGWKQGGRTVMKDWRTACRNWARRAPTFNGHGLAKNSGSAAAAPFDPKRPNAHTGGVEVVA